MMKIFLLVGVIPLTGIHFIDKAIRCEKSGYTRDDAVKIADKKIEVDFITHFQLQNAAFTKGDQSWNFTYNSGGCIAYVNIDRCGVSDITGLTRCNGQVLK